MSRTSCTPLRLFSFICPYIGRVYLRCLTIVNGMGPMGTGGRLILRPRRGRAACPTLTQEEYSLLSSRPCSDARMCARHQCRWTKSPRDFVVDFSVAPVKTVELKVQDGHYGHGNAMATHVADCVQALPTQELPHFKWYLERAFHLRSRCLTVLLPLELLFFPYYCLASVIYPVHDCAVVRP